MTPAYQEAAKADIYGAASRLYVIAAAIQRDGDERDERLIAKLEWLGDQVEAVAARRDFRRKVR